MNKRKTGIFLVVLVALGIVSYLKLADAAEDCTMANVICVGPGKQFTTIQAAVNTATAGKIVLVFDGTYAGFGLNSRSGTLSNPIVIKAAGTGAIINSRPSGGSGEYIWSNFSSYFTIEGFRVDCTNGTSYCIGIHSGSTTPIQGITIRNNIVNGPGATGGSGSESTNIYLSHAANSLIEGNITYGSKLSHGIYLANGGSDNTIIRNNISYNNAKMGIHLNGDVSVGGDGLITGVIIEGNTLYGNSTHGIDMDGAQNITIRNNLIYNNNYYGIVGFNEDGAAGPKDHKIYNNTIIARASGTDYAVGMHNDLGGHVFFNNILLKEGSSGGSIMVGNPNFSSNYNIVVDKFSRDDDASTINFASWKSFGRDANSVISTAAALFVNPAGNDYRLKAGAPAINFGVTSFSGISAPLTDILGAARPQGGVYDAGAYEFGGTTPIPTPTPSPTPTLTPTPTSTTSPMPGVSFTFTATGDIGGGTYTATTTTLQHMAAQNGAFMLALGDLNYSQQPSETAWCNYIKNIFGQNYPVQLEVGNHEDGRESGGPDGYIQNFVACLPDRMNSIVRSGNVYGREYYFDYPSTGPLARFIMLPAGESGTQGGSRRTYQNGSTDQAWLNTTIDQARSSGIKWIIVGMHMLCPTMGEKSCNDWDASPGPDLFNFLVNKKVDLVLHGHDHVYQRTKQLALSSSCTNIPVQSEANPSQNMPSRTANTNCIVDSDDSLIKGAGTVVITSGITPNYTWPYEMNLNDPEKPYFKSYQDYSYGYTKVSISSSQLTSQFISTGFPSGGSAFSDSFTVTDSSATPTPTPTPKFGDIDRDGDVDIFDYNRLVGRFGQTGTLGWIPEDIDSNGVINIFDYNLLVGNFGK